MPGPSTPPRSLSKARLGRLDFATVPGAVPPRSPSLSGRPGIGRSSPSIGYPHMHPLGAPERQNSVEEQARMLLGMSMSMSKSSGRRH